jgi:hypothetical protein
MTFQFLANLSSNPHSASSLALRSSVISWIEMQLKTKMADDGEYLAWTKILENLLITVDKDRANKATRGEYIVSIARCLQLILQSVDGSGMSHRIIPIDNSIHCFLRYDKEYFQSEVTAINLACVVEIGKSTIWMSGSNRRRHSRYHECTPAS